MHAAERTADDEPQMRDIEPLGDEPLHAVDHIVAAIVREIAFKPVGGLARAAAAERVGDD